MQPGGPKTGRTVRVAGRPPFGLGPIARVSTVPAPGSAGAATPPDRMEAMKNATQLGRVGTPEDCVGPLLFFAKGSESGYVTGQILHVNGGQYMP